MNLGLDIIFVFDKAGVYDFFRTDSTLPFGWLIKLGTDITDKAEVLIELGCCSARRLSQRSVFNFFGNIVGTADRFCFKTCSTILFG